MNNSVNYSRFIDLLISSDDDYEPYGITTAPDSYRLTASSAEYESTQTALYDRAMYLSYDD